MSDPSPYPFCVGGEWRSRESPPSGRAMRDVLSIVNPFSRSRLGDVVLASREDADEAITRARAGFAMTRKLPSYRRSEILFTISKLIRDRKDELAALITAEVGKAVRFSRIEVDRAVMTFQLAAEEAKRIGGEVVSLDLASNFEGRFGVVRRFPIGVVLGIVPFNFPLNLAAHKLAPAIAAGNAFILKPPPQAPVTGLKLGEIVLEAGLPAEALSVLPCPNDVAEMLVRDERIAMLSFTGSPTVGWHLKSIAGKKKVLLELGGNAGVIVDRTADIDDAVKKNVIGSFVYSGQVCIKVQRIYVHEEVFDEYSEKFVTAAQRLKVGDPSDPETVVGPLIDFSAAERVAAWVEEAVAEGARLLCGGKRTGAFVEPTVLVNVSRRAKVFCNEIFGPVVTLHRFDTIEEAVEGINDSRFGLQAGIFSNDHRSILDAFRAIDVGAVIVNDNPTFRVDNMPYGGIKDSGFGREGVRYAIEAMTEPKMLVMG